VVLACPLGADAGSPYFEWHPDPAILGRPAKGAEQGLTSKQSLTVFLEWLSGTIEWPPPSPIGRPQRHTFFLAIGSLPTT